MPLPTEAPSNEPKPVWGKMGNGYERFKLRRGGGEKIPPVEPSSAPQGDNGPNGGYGVPGGYGYGDPAVPPHSAPAARPLRTAQEELEDEYGASAGPGPSADGQEEQVERTESDEEVEATKQQMRFTKQESLSSSRNALRLAREAEETAMNSMMRLGDQSEKLADSERNLDLGKAYAHRADDNAREMERLNSSIFKPHMTFNKKSKRAAEEARIINRHVDEREERERLRAEAFQTQRRVDDTLGGPGSSSRFNASRFNFGKNKGLQSVEEDPKATKLAQRSRYQFEATASDDEFEDELDDNLDDIGHIAGTLGRLGKTMGNEIEEQNNRLGRLGEKTTNLDTKVYTSTYRLENMKH